METIRAFFAIRPPAKIRKAIVDIIASLNQRTIQHSVRWTENAHLHVTLNYLHTLRYDDIDNLSNNVKASLNQFKHFKLQLGKVELFPSLNKPKFISLQAGPNETLANLSGNIGSAIINTGYTLDGRPFRGHLTLGRISNTHQDLAVLEQMALPALNPFEVSEFYLFESKPNQKGSVYISLAKFCLEDLTEEELLDPADKPQDKE